MNEKSTDSNSAENSPGGDDQWVGDTVRTHLDSKVDELDFNVTSKLSAARHRAMATDISSNRESGVFGKWLASPVLFSGVAVMALTFVLGSQYMSGEIAVPADQPVQLTQSDLIEDMNMLSATEDLEFFEAMEFLEWMENNSG